VVGRVRTVSAYVPAEKIAPRVTVLSAEGARHG